MDAASFRTRADADPIFTREALSALADTCLRVQDASDPRASPLREAMPRLPIHTDVGDDEVLLDDAVSFATLAGAAGAPVTLNVWQGMPRVFQARVRALAAATQSFDAAGALVDEHLAADLWSRRMR